MLSRVKLPRRAPQQPVSGILVHDRDHGENLLCSAAKDAGAPIVRRERAMPHKEQHRTQRTGWLRAAVLGANDGIVSTASLLIGVASAHATRSGILIAGICLAQIIPRAEEQQLPGQRRIVAPKGDSS